METVNLYSVGNDGSIPEKPFLHQVLFNGPNGEIVRVRGLFDDGAMVGVMDLNVFSKVKGRLGCVTPSKRRLRMANGVIIPSLAHWRGWITLGTIKAEGEFEVFDSGGEWAFLFSKPLLRAFNAIHDYAQDKITVSGLGGTCTLYNQATDPNYTHLSKSAGVNLTLDVKQFCQVSDKRESKVGGTEPPARGVDPSNVLENMKNITKLVSPAVISEQTPVATKKKRRIPKRVQRERQRLRHKTEFLANLPKAPIIGGRRWEITKPKGKRAESKGSSTLPAREVPPHMDSVPTCANINPNTSDNITPVCLVSDSEEAKLQDIGSEIPTSGLKTDTNIFTRHTNPFKEERVKAILSSVELGNDLTEEEQARAQELLKEYADCFALSVSEVRQVPNAVHHLNVPPDAKFSTKVHQRPLTPPQRQYLNKKIDEMLDAGIIEQVEPSRVKCVSPTTLAQKAHEGGGLTLEELQQRINAECASAGLDPYFDASEKTVTPPIETSPKEQKWRVCQNFGEVNRVTEIAAMPQGDIRLKQQRLSGHRYISVFDFASGFYAVEVDQEYRPYTAFYVEGRGYFWYARMPFGLTGAPSTFAHMTATHLHDLLNDEIMELFVDDGGTAADTFEDMLSKLRCILTRVRERHLSLSATKSQFFMTEAIFAGGRVGPEGVMPDLTKLTAIVDWEKPADALNLASFLGITGHFRDLVKDYAKLEQPLRDLIRDVKLPEPCSKTTYRRIMSEHKLDPVWNMAHTKAFVRLKAIITTEPVLRCPKWDGTPFIVTTDGCKEGFAGVLSQRFKTTLPSGKVVEKLHPIAFASKRTSRAEERYKPFLLEFAALKFALDKFSNVIWGFPVEIETDCQAIRDVMLNDKLNANHARWRDGILAHHIIDVRHVPGKINVVADGISRKWEGRPRSLGDGSEWTVSEDWDANTGLANDILHVSTEDTSSSLCERFRNEPLFLEVINSILAIKDKATTLRDRKRAGHRASQYMIDDGKLWRLKGGTSVRGRARVECVTQEEARTLALKQHMDNGHWRRDSIKIALMDRIWCPCLDAAILDAIKDCGHCKNFGSTHIHSLLEPITRRHPFELLVGDYLTMPIGRGGLKTIGVYLDVFSQHVWVQAFKTAGSSKTTIKTLERIFHDFLAAEVFMSDGGTHFNSDPVRTFCKSWGCKPHVVSAYSPWINGLVEGTNKILLHVLKRLCAPGLGDDEYDNMDWDSLPKSWPLHLDEAVLALNTRILPNLKFSPKELLLGMVVNTPRTPLADSGSVLLPQDANTHIAYVAQQHLDGYDAIVRHALSRKAAFDRRVLAKSPGEVIFTQGQLVQVYRSDLDYTFKAERKILPKWSPPHCIRKRLRNSYRLENRDGTAIKGTFSSRRLRTFIPREGTKLAMEQKEFEEKLKAKGPEADDEDKEEDEEDGTEEEDEHEGEEGVEGHSELSEG